jgi:hypothetical protein
MIARAMRAYAMQDGALVMPTDSRDQDLLVFAQGQLNDGVAAFSQ